MDNDDNKSDVTQILTGLDAGDESAKQRLFSAAFAIRCIVCRDGSSGKF